MSEDIFQVKCSSCNELLQEPYIECCQCPTSLCTPCFSTGREVSQHRNDHKYAVRKNDFPLFNNCNWSAKEEYKLLTALATHGYGNWEDIAKSVHSRTMLECQEHYKKYYIDNVQLKELDVIPHTEQSMFPKPLTPYLYSTKVSRDPPRNNSSDQHLAGYNAYRSEFELSYDHNAESIFNIEDNCSDDEDDDCTDALKISLVNALNNRLRERQRRYKIIQNHGLIMPHKFVSWLQRFDKTLMRYKMDKLASFMQFMTGMQFDAFVESLSLEAELFQRLYQLTEFRKMGIRTLYGVKMYRQEKKEHEVVMKEQKLAAIAMTKHFENQPRTKACFGKAMNMKKTKRVMNPLDIMDLPGYHLLNDNEKSLCSKYRLIPKNYLEIKEVLIAENDKLGSLRLLDARKIVKIDVNKTRKIYDFLVHWGYVNVPLPLSTSTKPGQPKNFNQ